MELFVHFTAHKTLHISKELASAKTNMCQRQAFIFFSYKRSKQQDYTASRWFNKAKS